MGFNLIQQECGLKHQQILPFAIVKWSIVLSLALKKPKIARWKFSDNHLQKILEKMSKLRKSYNHKRNSNGIYNEKMQYNCLQQLPT